MLSFNKLISRFFSCASSQPDNYNHFPINLLQSSDLSREDKHLLDREFKKIESLKRKFESYNSQQIIDNQSEIFELDNSYQLENTYLNQDLFNKPNDMLLLEYQKILEEKRKLIIFLKERINRINYIDLIKNCDCKTIDNFDCKTIDNFDNYECPICLEDLQLKKIIKLRCCHTYHHECLYNWFLKTKSKQLCIYNCQNCDKDDQDDQDNLTA